MATAKVWNGTSWVDKTAKADFSYWNGTAWTVPNDVRYWDGGTWQTLFAAPPVGSVAYRTGNTATINAANSITIGIPATVQTGDLLVLVVAQTSSAATVFGAISGWSKQGELRAGSAAFTLAVYTRLAQAGDAGANVVATSVNIENLTAHVRAYSGVNQTTPLDTAVAFQAIDTNTATGTTPTVNVTTSGSMLLAFYGVPTTANTVLTNANWTDPVGFTNELVSCSNSTANNACIGTYNLTAPSTGSQGPFTVTITQTRRWTTGLLVIRPA